MMRRKELEAESESISKRLTEIANELKELREEQKSLIEQRAWIAETVNRLLAEELEQVK